jgi:3-oxoacyl-(acyl-carrier-protein) synthase
MDFYIRNISSISPQQTFETDKFLPVKTEMQPDAVCMAAIEPDYKKYITDAGLRRRMSRIIKMGVAAALDCVEKAEVKNPDAIITATGLGCLADTGKFLSNIVENEEGLLNPTSFIQSTFNTIGAQIALILKNHNYNFTYVHRGFSFESAMLDAMMQLKEGDARNVLVGGVDEITPTSADVTERMGFWRNGAKMGEGAQFFVLSSFASGKDYAKLKAVNTFLLPEGHSIQSKINLFFKNNGITPDQIDLVMLGNSGDVRQDKCMVEAKETVFRNIPSVTFKHLCGEYQTASSFGLWCAANILYRQELPVALNPGKDPGIINRIVLYNVYRNTNHSLFLIERAE